VGVNSWVAHANTDVFGLDASVFRPERWLVDKDRYNAMDRNFLAVGLLVGMVKEHLADHK
jgi:hypothetical protein